MSECFSKKTLVKKESVEESPLKEEGRMAVLAPSRVEEGGKLRPRKESSSCLYAKKMHDSSLNTTARRDSLKKSKGPGVSMLKELYHCSEQKSGR